MTLNEQLQQDLHQAIRDRDAERKTAIRLVRAAVVNEEIAKQRELEDEEILALVRREVRQHRESLAEFKKGGRADLVAEQEAQLEVLLAYLPQQMSQDDIVAAAKQAIMEANAQGPQHLGQVMRVLMPRVQGRADGKVVNEVVRELLGTKD